MGLLGSQKTIRCLLWYCAIGHRRLVARMARHRLFTWHWILRLACTFSTHQERSKLPKRYRRTRPCALSVTVNFAASCASADASKGTCKMRRSGVSRTEPSVTCYAEPYVQQARSSYPTQLYKSPARKRKRETLVTLCTNLQVLHKLLLRGGV